MEQDNLDKNPALSPEAAPGAMDGDAPTAGEGGAENAPEADAELSPEAAEIARLRAELAAAQAKADDYLDKLQRSAADFQNSRRRLETQQADEIERANGALIKRLLPVLDDLDLAFQNVPEALRDGMGDAAGEAVEQKELGSQQAWVRGFVQIRKKLLDLLAEQGVKPIATDDLFDPNRHEAISSEPSDTVAAGHVIAEVRAGYEYKGRVLRPALVRVAM
jgi:molecular chaperone GrpE